MLDESPTDPLAHVRLLARYHGWAHARLWRALEAADDTTYHAERRAFFGSVHGTVNHMLVADTLWLDRVEGEPPSGLALDAIVASDRAAAAAMRTALDRRFEELVDGLDLPELLESPVVYRDSKGITRSTPLFAVLVHVVNHGTHHRGQVSDMLSDLELPTPEMDLIYFLREVGASS